MPASENLHSSGSAPKGAKGASGQNRRVNSAKGMSAQPRIATELKPAKNDEEGQGTRSRGGFNKSRRSGRTPLRHHEAHR